MPVSISDDAFPDRAALASIFREVKTERLVLRCLRSSDGPALFAVHGDPETYRYSPATPHPDLATSEQMLQECLHHWEVYGFGIWAVTLAQQEHVIGFGGIERWIWREREKNIPSIRTAERAGLVRRPDQDTEHTVFALGWPPDGNS